MRTKNDEWSVSLDSFFDILTNVVGVMVLIALLTVLSAGDITVHLGTPVLHPPPREARPVHFECRQNQVFLIEADDFVKEFQEHMAEYARRAQSFPERSDLERILEKKDFGDAHYRLKADSRSLFLEPRRWTSGQSVRQIAEAGSEYLEKLKSLDTNDYYLYFLVRSDSFGAFRRARRLARDLGFPTGWIPLSKGELLRIGGGKHQVQ